MKFILNIKPIPLKRPRFARSGRVYNSQKKEMLEVSHLIKSQCNHVFSGPLRIDITFYMQIPKSYSKIKQHRLNGGYHVLKVDLDNLIKALCDEITMSGIIEDDCQFAIINSKKVLSLEGKIEFEINNIVQ